MKFANGIIAVVWLCAFSRTEPAAQAEEPRKLVVEMGVPFQELGDSTNLDEGAGMGLEQAGATVTVQFASQSRTAVAGEDGKWMLELNPRKASTEPARMVITEAGSKSETLADMVNVQPEKGIL